MKILSMLASLFFLQVSYAYNISDAGLRGLLGKFEGNRIIFQTIDFPNISDKAYKKDTLETIGIAKNMAAVAGFSKGAKIYLVVCGQAYSDSIQSIYYKPDPRFRNHSFLIFELENNFSCENKFLDTDYYSPSNNVLAYITLTEPRFFNYRWGKLKDYPLLKSFFTPIIPKGQFVANLTPQAADEKLSLGLIAPGNMFILQAEGNVLGDEANATTWLIKQESYNFSVIGKIKDMFRCEPLADVTSDNIPELFCVHPYSEHAVIDFKNNELLALYRSGI